MNFDLIVVGAGHAGLEASFIASKLGLKVGLFNINLQSVANLPCNPSIGGPAKGVVTREIDALGGIQGIAADKNKIQIKKVNGSKGPGVWAYRAQIDKNTYHEWFLEQIDKNSNIELILGEVTGLLTESNKVIGVETKDSKFYSSAVIITAGTYLRSEIFRECKIADQGPDGYPSSNHLSNSLIKLGIELIRLKTGTSPRIYKNTINFSKLVKDDVNDENISFSFVKPKNIKKENQLYCYLTETSEATRKLILDNLTNLGTYNGSIIGVGPRYCPSIEDKFIKFPSRRSHHIFVEPISRSCDYVYLAGLSTSLNKDLQENLVRTLKGFEEAKIHSYAYSIVYDAINPVDLYRTLEHKSVENLYFAGQMNGTSGYEEAAAQGLIAGINASLKIQNKSPFILRRDESYIGVMIDDLTSKGTKEPYRLLTSRAEYRLLLRNDNADERLMKKGYELGTIDKEVYELNKQKLENIEKNIEFLRNNYASKYKLISSAEGPITLFSWLSRPESSYRKLQKTIGDKLIYLDDESIEKLEIKVRYEGYIKQQRAKIEKVDKWKKISLLSISDYSKIANLSLEAIEKLNKFKPILVEDALRINGVDFNDIFWIKVYLDRRVLV